MTKMFKVLIILLVATSFSVMAENNDSKVNAVLKQLQKRFGNAKQIKVKPSPVKSLYEVTMGSRIFYISEDGTYLIAGHMWNIITNKNLSSNSLNAVRKKVLDGMKESDMIVFSPPKDKIKYTITVFTDLDCQYCRIMHSKIKGYTALGIKVRYVLYPRAGKGAPSYTKAISVWCHKDRNTLFTSAKTGQSVPAKVCAHPIDSNVAIGASLGIRGTPAIFFSNGRIVPGYVDPARLLPMLKSEK